MPGPRTTETWRASASVPMALPMRSARSGFQVWESPTAGGKQVAGTLSDKPSASEEPSCLRSPLGPSVIAIDGRSPSDLVCQKFLPLVSRACSAVDNDDVAIGTPRCDDSAPRFRP